MRGQDSRSPCRMTSGSPMRSGHHGHVNPQDGFPPDMEPITFQIPSLRALARHALPHLAEATIVPLVLFYLSMWLLGIWGALGVGLLWSYGAILRRVVTGRRVPGILVLGALAMTARTLIAVASGSVFIYFLQPTLGTV